jgi:hypothetical protein
MFFAALELASDAWKAKLSTQVDVVALLQARLRDLSDSDSDSSPHPFHSQLNAKAGVGIRRYHQGFEYEWGRQTSYKRCKSTSAGVYLPAGPIFVGGEKRVRNKSTPLTRLSLPSSKSS